MSLTDAEQLRAARSMLGLTQSELAEQSGVSLPTIKRLELGQGLLPVRLAMLLKLQRALETAGVEFIAAGNGSGPGLRLKTSAERFTPAGPSRSSSPCWGVRSCASRIPGSGEIGKAEKRRSQAP